MSARQFRQIRLLFAVKMITQNMADEGGHFTAQFGHDALDDDVLDIVAGFVNEMVG
jgi:hypothetical protein